jgi:hypothetical protein
MHIYFIRLLQQADPMNIAVEQVDDPGFPEKMQVVDNCIPRNFCPEFDSSFL